MKDRLQANDLVLVTGGAGYVGSHVVRLFLQRGYRVRVLDAFLYGGAGLRGCAADPQLEIVYGDICNVRDMIRAAKDAKVIVALGALVGDSACELNRDETLAINIEATRLLCSVVRFSPTVERVLFASTCSVYGAADGLVLNEGSRLNPVSFYARSRIASEGILTREIEGGSWVVLRLGTVFGASPRMRLDLMVNTMTYRAVAQRKITVTGGQAWRPHLHVKDAAQAFVMAAEAPRDKVGRETFNVGSDGSNVRVSEVAEIVASQVPDTKVEYVEASEDLRSYRVSFDKIRYVLGFTGGYGIEDGVREVRAMLERREINGSDERYSNLRCLEKHGFGNGFHQVGGDGARLSELIAS